ncbi:MAG: hypothetical protein ACPGSE_00360 [Synechococcus sp.]
MVKALRNTMELHYLAEQQKIREQIARLEQKLRIHARRFKAGDQDLQMIGDLQKINSELGELTGFVS